SCRERGSSVADVLTGAKEIKALDKSGVKAIKDILRREDIFAIGLRKPCGPFIADYGIGIGNSQIRDILLISSSCQLGRLVQADAISDFIYNFHPDGFIELRKTFDKLLTR